MKHINWDQVDLNRHASIIAKEVGCHVSNVMRRQQRHGIQIPKMLGKKSGNGRFQKLIAQDPSILLLGPNELSRRIGCTLTRAYSLCNGVSWRSEPSKRGPKAFVPEETPENVEALHGKLWQVAAKFKISLPTAMRIRKKFRAGTLWEKKVVAGEAVSL